MKKKWYKRPSVLIILGLLVGGVTYGAFRPDPAPEYSSVIAKRIDLVQSVRETGVIAPTTDISFGFEATGRVVAIYHQVGDSVVSGDSIAELDAARQLASVRQAEASLAAAQATLDKRIAGATAQEIEESLSRIAQAEANLKQVQAQREQTAVGVEIKISDAEAALKQAENNLQLVDDLEASELVSQAYEQLVTQLKNSLREIDTALGAFDLILGLDDRQANDAFEQDLGITDLQTLNVAKASYQDVRTQERVARSLVEPLLLESAFAEVDLAQDQMNSTLQALRALATDMTYLMNATSAESQLTQDELDALRADVRLTTAGIDQALQAFLTKRQAVDQAKATVRNYTIAYDRAVSQLAQVREQGQVELGSADALVDIRQAALEQARAAHKILTAPPRDVDIASLRADVAGRYAALTAARDEYNKTRLTALADGVLSTLDIDIGEQAIANSPVAEIISPQVHIEVDVSESEIASVGIGDSAEITLDAFGDDVVFEGKVVQIDPAETQISGVVYYRTTVVLVDPKDQPIRAGMTANVDIVTEQKQDVLVVPSRAVFERDGERYVRVLLDPARASYREVPVDIGIRGNDGLLEILSGVQVGDEVITFLSDPT
jgi:HlyD family secretion protein